MFDKANSTQASTAGAKGGKSTSKKKQKAARLNGSTGGRPKMIKSAPNTPTL